MSEALKSLLVRLEVEIERTPRQTIPGEDLSWICRLQPGDRVIVNVDRHWMQYVAEVGDDAFTTRNACGEVLFLINRHTGRLLRRFHIELHRWVSDWRQQMPAFDACVLQEFLPMHPAHQEMESRQRTLRILKPLH